MHRVANASGSRKDAIGILPVAGRPARRFSSLLGIDLPIAESYRNSRPNGSSNFRLALAQAKGVAMAQADAAHTRTTVVIFKPSE
jgi:hypothetical protein